MVKHVLETSNAQNEPLPDLSSLKTLSNYQSRLKALLEQRRILTQQLKRHGKCNPPLLLKRAIIYELLEYEDLAVFDAYAVYILCLKRLADQFVTDIEAFNLNGDPWNPSIGEAGCLLVDVLALLVRCLTALGATQDAQDKLKELSEQLELVNEGKHTPQSLEALLHKPDILHQRADTQYHKTLQDHSKTPTRFGHSRREIYPWSNCEPDRNSATSIAEVNAYLTEVAPNLEAKVTELPALSDGTGQTTDEKWFQLGLFAKRELKPGEEVLREKSILTAIRPLDAAICDACGQDLEGLSFGEVQQCDGEDCDVTFCSRECKERAVGEYHRPYIEETDTEPITQDEGDTPEDKANSNNVSPSDSDNDSTTHPTFSQAPFCGNTDLHTIGRPTLTETPEWDLYFLLLTRTIAMSITQNTHPLHLKEIKYLWGDFNPTSTPPPPSPSPSPAAAAPRTLPFSLTHNIVHSLDFFTELSQTVPLATPYSAWWIEHFDAWILQTLFAKFRGVANAQQSTFDGQPEIAAVHPAWCLANHSCKPNVRWTPTGVRRFVVLTEEERANVFTPEGEETRHEQQQQQHESKWAGIKAGEEVLSHYTDVRLPVRERRERLLEVLGGVCRCKRCLRESGGDL